jgi:cell wall-associated NlpC family hydrolase
LQLRRLLVPGFALFALAMPSTALGAGGSGLTGATAKTRTKTKKVATADNGGAGINGPAQAPSTTEHPTVAGDTARIINGVAYAPSYAPTQVKKAIWAGNQIRKKPYIYGGGHGQWKDSGYDCSGSVSYVLHAAGLLKVSEDSSGFESWAKKGIGQWVTVYTNPAHAFIEVAGIRFDTSAEDDPHPPPGTGPRWRPLMHGAPGFEARHPAGL